MAVFFSTSSFLVGPGQPLFKCKGEIDAPLAIDQITRAFAELHRLQIRHGDAAARNILYVRGPMVVDFREDGNL